MKAISFEIGGKSAMFKKPDVNSYAYFTYNNIHKPALLGILGAIIGLKGYTNLHDKKAELALKIKESKGKEKKQLQDEKSILDKSYPEYYEKLKHLKISIIPLAKNGYFSKKIQTFNNSVGYASFEQGGNLVVREQWLENPRWQIIILEDESYEYKKIKEYLLNKKAIYIPYLGKNNHPANIERVEEIMLEESKQFDKIDSLFKENEFTVYPRAGRNILPFIFKENSPISLQKDFHFYENEALIYTNQKVQLKSDNEFIYLHSNKNYFFF